jgi:hypothetical protein
MREVEDLWAATGCTLNFTPFFPVYSNVDWCGCNLWATGQRCGNCCAGDASGAAFNFTSLIPVPRFLY